MELIIFNNYGLMSGQEIGKKTVDKVFSLFGGSIFIRDIDVCSSEGSSLVENFSVDVTPSIVLLNDDGGEIGTVECFSLFEDGNVLGKVSVQSEEKWFLDIEQFHKMVKQSGWI